MIGSHIIIFLSMLASYWTNKFTCSREYCKYGFLSRASQSYANNLRPYNMGSWGYDTARHLYQYPIRQRNPVTRAADSFRKFESGANSQRFLR